MSDTDMFEVSATDGLAKRWMWDSQWHELPAGQERVLPMGPAFQAVAFYTTRDANGEKVSTVEVSPFAGEVRLQPVAAPAHRFADEDGTEYGSLTELIAAVKERVGASGNERPTRGTKHAG